MLYSRSFRAPSLKNVLLDTTGAKPEKSNVFELELGYQFTPEMLLAVNAFHITTKDVIIYGSDEENDFVEWYENYEKSGTSGVEVVYSIRKKKWYSNITYSYSRAIKDNTVDKYEVPQTSSQYVGVPAHKITLNANYYILPFLTVNPTVIYAGKRYAYTHYDEDLIAEKLVPYTLINLFVNYKPSIVSGLTCGIGVYDVLNERPAVPQAYNGGDGAYAPIPLRSREFLLKLSYQINFSK